MVMQYRGSVVVLDDAAGYADDMAERLRGIFPDVYRLTSAPSQDDHAVTVSTAHLDVKTLVRTMVQQGACWGLIPRDRDPVTVIVDYLVAARQALAEGSPALVLVSAAPNTRYERIAIVADVRAPVTTGVLALIGVGLALRLGTTLDVLLLGADSDNAPTTWPQVEALLEIRAGAEDLQLALRLADDEGLAVNWLALGDSANRDQLLLDAVADGGYDLVLDDLGAVDVGPVIGRRRRVKRQLLEQQTDAAYRLLRDAPCDVGIVVDAVTMNLVPGGALAAGAAAALSLGVVGGAVQPPPSAPTQAAMVETAEGAAPPEEPAAAEEAVAQAQAQAQDAAPAQEAPPAPVVSIPAPPVAELPSRMSAEDLGAYRSTFSGAESEAAAAQAELDARAAARAAAEQALVLAQTDLALQRSDVASAQATMDSAQERLDYAGKGRDKLSEAEEARALGSLNTAKRDVQRKQGAADRAQAALDDARRSVTAAADSVAAQQSVVDQHNANIAGWNDFLSAAGTRTPKTVAPVSGYSISTGYGVSGSRWSSGRHTGIDFAAPSGTTVMAAADGVVTFAGRNGPYGNQVKVKHSDGTTTAYAHLSSISVSEGRQVSAGQKLGGVGSTGNSTGPHLHFEVIDGGGGFQNPQSWLRSKGAI